MPQCRSPCRSPWRSLGCREEHLAPLVELRLGLPQQLRLVELGAGHLAQFRGGLQQLGMQVLRMSGTGGLEQEGAAIG